MNLDEIRTAVTTSEMLRVPTFLDGQRGRATEKLGKLEDFVLASAQMRDELVIAWRYCNALVRRFEEQTMDLPIPTGRSAEERERAKRDANPELWGALRDARALLSEILAQMKRLDKDYDAVSRAYTIITGHA